MAGNLIGYQRPISKLWSKFLIFLNIQEPNNQYLISWQIKEIYIKNLAQLTTKSTINHLKTKLLGNRWKKFLTENIK